MKKAETESKLALSTFSMQQACASNRMQAVEVMSIVSRQLIALVGTFLGSPNSHGSMSTDILLTFFTMVLPRIMKAFNALNHSFHVPFHIHKIPQKASAFLKGH